MLSTSYMKTKRQNEIVNTTTHFIGLLLSIFALVLMLIKSNNTGNVVSTVSAVIFGMSMIVLYAASSIYHYVSKLRLKFYLNKIDHSAIYLLIAGTYTPFTLLVLPGAWGWSIFGIVWNLALAGIIFKIFWYRQKYKAISAIAYVLMGLVIVVAIKPLVGNLHSNGVFWLVAGGVSYIGGVFFYLSKKIKFSHGIFHLFVLLGTYCHFHAIYYYVLPQ